MVRASDVDHVGIAGSRVDDDDHVGWSDARAHGLEALGQQSRAITGGHHHRHRRSRRGLGMPAHGRWSAMVLDDDEPPAVAMRGTGR